ncbi:MAG: hypothetical protein CMB80_01300 [Flammeovirgaceae bacterium]|nr:hypothetical protein [Flammeovirgaceae bacterium]
MSNDIIDGCDFWTDDKFWRSVEEDLHMRLNFNGMVMTISDDSSRCHPEAKFWMPFHNVPRLHAYCKLSGVAKINCKEHFGKLVAGGIVYVC